MATVTDPRVRFVNIPRPTYPPGELDAWHVSGSWAVNAGLDAARGAYTALLGDDDEYMPTYLEETLAAIADQDVDAVYCASEVWSPDGFRGYLGRSFPPAFAQQSGGELIWRANNVRMDVTCWQRGMPNDWTLWSDLIAAGVRFGHLQRPLYRYHAARHVPPAHATL
jgi:glycosyltransferase involved in cell wall biosynthesis